MMLFLKKSKIRQIIWKMLLWIIKLKVVSYRNVSWLVYHHFSCCALGWDDCEMCTKHQNPWFFKWNCLVAAYSSCTEHSQERIGVRSVIVKLNLACCQRLEYGAWWKCEYVHCCTIVWSFYTRTLGMQWKKSAQAVAVPMTECYS